MGGFSLFDQAPKEVRAASKAQSATILWPLPKGGIRTGQPGNDGDDLVGVGNAPDAGSAQVDRDLPSQRNGRALAGRQWRATRVRCESVYRCRTDDDSAPATP